MDPQHLFTASLRATPSGAAITRILAAALDAVAPKAAVQRWVRRDGTLLQIGARSYDLTRYERVLLVGAGKAALPMAEALAEQLGDDLRAGLVVVKQGYAAESHAAAGMSPRRYTIVEAGHPLPDQRGLAGTRQIAELLAGATEHDLVIALISGGGSALLTLPQRGIQLADLQALTATLLACGATINEINALRKHLDQIKGGGLARMAYPATLVTLILSDVVGDPLDVIASGPTVPDPMSFQDAWSVLERYQLVAAVPAAIHARLQAGLRGEVPETPKAGDPVFAQTQNLLVGSNQLAARGALEAAQAEGYNALLLTDYAVPFPCALATIKHFTQLPLEHSLALLKPPFQGEARVVGRLIAQLAHELATSRLLARPACLIMGGETTVTLRGSGVGGRNQELALATVADLAGLPEITLVTLATDGGDGPTAAAGAVVTGATLEHGLRCGLDPATHLERNDSYTYFAALDDLLCPGPTQTNVNDLVFVFAS